MSWGLPDSRKAMGLARAGTGRSSSLGAFTVACSGSTRSVPGPRTDGPRPGRAPCAPCSQAREKASPPA